ncbi:MAG: class I SAM-dependent methyltransferase [Chlamydiae bacterium]|nr:class I SAM-dependent methyltransferase [Chlamydiota bacterium]
MSKRPPTVQPEWDLLFPLLIEQWRKLHKLPIGPTDRLQTREFRSLVEHVRSYLQNEDLSTREHLGAHLLYEWPIRYAEGISLLKELPSIPQKVLELGSGTAPFAFAALQHGAREVLAMGDHTKAMQEGANICGSFGYPITFRSYSEGNSTCAGKWDLILLPYRLFRLFSSREEQVRYVRSLIDNSLAEGGHLLIVESSVSGSNKALLALRDELAAQGCKIRAPCLWQGTCPALQHGSYCYAQRELEKPFLLKEIQRACQINFSSLKMSYLLLASNKTVLPMYQDTYYRVVSPKVSTYKGDRFFLCGVKGSKTLGSSLKEQPKQTKAFSYLRRGDVVSIANTKELEGDFQLTEASTLQLVAPYDKPVPS